MGTLGTYMVLWSPSSLQWVMPVRVVGPLVRTYCVPGNVTVMYYHNCCLQCSIWKLNKTHPSHRMVKKLAQHHTASVQRAGLSEILNSKQESQSLAHRHSLTHIWWVHNPYILLPAHQLVQHVVVALVIASQVSFPISPKELFNFDPNVLDEKQPQWG